MRNGELIRAIESASARAWPPENVVFLHGWQLRHGSGNSRRLRSVRAVAFDGRCETQQAVDEAANWYRDRGLPPCFQITDTSEPENLDETLAAAGFAYITPTSVLHCPGAGLAGALDTDLAVFSVVNDDVLDAICDPAWGAAVRAERRDLFRRIPATPVFAVAYRNGSPVAGGLCVIDRGLAGIFSMRTQPAARRQGFARRIFAHLIAEAKAREVSDLYLQVEDHNEAALRLYREAGFTRLFGYHYREK